VKSEEENLKEVTKEQIEDEIIHRGFEKLQGKKSKTYVKWKLYRPLVLNKWWKFMLLVSVLLWLLLVVL
jgi:hypothetical protein